MDFFIIFCRALAALVITNAHYDKIYPLSVFANGGLLGDVIFFAVSGYCIVNIKLPFQKWYLKRFLRIYPAVWIMTIVCILWGVYHIASAKEFFGLFIFPTNYHFVASIMILYVLYYIIMSVDLLKNNLKWVMIFTFIAYLTIYIFAYDKSHYTIDNVRSGMIRFLFLESMLLGAWFKLNKNRLVNNNKTWAWVCLIASALVYFVSKYALVSYSFLAPFQILNQVILFIVLYLFMRSMIGIEDSLNRIPEIFKKVISLLSSITLEIYIVQIVIIPRLSNIAIFPLNFIIVTGTILISAYILNKLNYLVNIPIKKLTEKSIKN